MSCSRRLGGTHSCVARRGPPYISCRLHELRRLRRGRKAMLKLSASVWLVRANLLQRRLHAVRECASRCCSMARARPPGSRSAAAQFSPGSTTAVTRDIRRPAAIRSLDPSGVAFSRAGPMAPVATACCPGALSRARPSNARYHQESSRCLKPCRSVTSSCIARPRATAGGEDQPNCSTAWNLPGLQGRKRNPWCWEREETDSRHPLGRCRQGINAMLILPRDLRRPMLCWRGGRDHVRAMMLRPRNDR